MADPIAIIGLVAGVVTFVDFGFKVVSSSRGVRKSLSGTTAEVGELDLIIEDIRASHDRIKSGTKGDQKLSDDENRILLMVKESESLYEQLRHTISKLEVRDDVRSKALETVRVAFQSMWKQSDLDVLANRLNRLDQRIRGNLVFALQLQQHSSVMSKLKAIQSSQEALGINHESKLFNIQKQIFDMMEEKEKKEKHMQEETRRRKRAEEKRKTASRDDKMTSKEKVERAKKEKKAKEKQINEDKDEMIAYQIAQLASLKTKLEVLQKEHSMSVTYVQVIESLYFPEVRRRFAQIPWADQRSNQWIFSPELTTFVPWLESTAPQDGIFYIFGKAGSGKSTLMKYLSENQRTLTSLKSWAGTAQLYTASYYFWNQGNDMQKSRTGLMQSLLYQVLRSAPQLIPSVCRERPREAWELDELVATFDRIASDTKLGSKFCFFIDGLDEYDGNESEVLPMLQVLSANPHIKICASSRPGRMYEKSLRNDQHAFDIAKFTREDMRQYVLKQLTTSEKFQALASSEPKCQDLITDISQYADGVWLWVFLVTRDIVYEVDRDEPLSTLRKIVDEFPADLEKYFQRIIEKIKDRHKEEMAQTFLVTTHELQPLPLYAFALLEEERINPDHALNAPIRHVSDEMLQDQYPIWSTRVQNRCGDLLVVDDLLEQMPLVRSIPLSQHPLPTLLTHSVDFLHRTVRDFLRDSFRDELQGYLKSDYNPLLSLCRICLSLLKALPADNIRNVAFANRVIALTDEMLYYAHEVERMRITQDTKSLVLLLDELDRVNSHHARDITNHWTHARDSPPAQGLDEYKEEGECNFLALAVQGRLVNYVRVKLQSEPQLMRKHGRPLLDYALRPRRTTPISMPYHSDRDDPSVDVEMVEMLLVQGADPNEQVHLYDGESVWKLFLTSISETSKQGKARPVPESLKTAWYKAAEVLIKAGAQWDRKFTFLRAVTIDNRNANTNDVLRSIFGIEAAAKLEELTEIGAQERDQQKSKLCSVM